MAAGCANDSKAKDSIGKSRHALRDSVAQDDEDSKACQGKSR